VVLKEPIKLQNTLEFSISTGEKKGKITKAESSARFLVSVVCLCHKSKKTFAIFLST